MKYKYDVEDQKGRIGQAEAAAGTAKNEVEKAGAGDLYINIDGKNLAKIPGVISSNAAQLAKENKVAGITS